MKVRPVNRDELIELLTGEANGETKSIDVFILLSGGGRSSKQIACDVDDAGPFICVQHHIDDSEEEFYSFAEMLEETNIGRAADKGALFIEDYEG